MFSLFVNQWGSEKYCKVLYKYGFESEWRSSVWEIFLLLSSLKLVKCFIWQVDLGKSTKVNALGLQGSFDNQPILKKFLLKNSMEGSSWSSVKNHANEKVIWTNLH